MNNQIIVLCGFSSAGKDSHAEYLKDIGYNFITSITTRPMRQNESQGNPYIFTDTESFMKLELLEHRQYETSVKGIKDIWHYGVTKDSIEDNKAYVVVLDILGLRAFKTHFGDRVISFFLECDEPTRRQRCINRKDFDIDEWNRRYEDDLREFPEDVVIKECDYIVPSYDFEETSDIIWEILDV